MTFEINNTEASFEQLENGKVKITNAGKVVGTFSAEQLTSLITISLAARKSAYEFKRTAKKAQREAAKAERNQAKLASKKDRIAKLQAELEQLQAA